MRVAGWIPGGVLWQGDPDAENEILLISSLLVQIYLSPEADQKRFGPRILGMISICGFALTQTEGTSKITKKRERYQIR